MRPQWLLRSLVFTPRDFQRRSFGIGVMGPRLREDDVAKFVGFKTVIPAKAGTHTTQKVPIRMRGRAAISTTPQVLRLCRAFNEVLQAGYGSRLSPGVIFGNAENDGFKQEAGFEVRRGAY